MTIRMRAILRFTVPGLLCLALAACGGSGNSGSSNTEQIQHVFASMQSAMAKGDYAGACQALSQREQAAVLAGAKQAGLSASDCADAFSALIKRTGVTKAQLARAFGGGQAPKIKSISVHGSQATVTYTSTDNGKAFTETDALVKQDGAWKADRTLSRHDGS